MSVPLLFSSKNASDVDDFSIDFTSLLAFGETITAASVTALPTGLTISAAQINKAVVTAWVAGGTAGTSYTLSYSATTSQASATGGFRVVVVEAILNVIA